MRLSLTSAVEGFRVHGSRFKVLPFLTGEGPGERPEFTSRTAKRFWFHNKPQANSELHIQNRFQKTILNIFLTLQSNTRFFHSCKYLSIFLLLFTEKPYLCPVLTRKVEAIKPIEA